MNHLWIIEFRVDGGEWEIFARVGYRNGKDAEGYLNILNLNHTDCEFRISKYQRVEGE